MDNPIIKMAKEKLRIKDRKELKLVEEFMEYAGGYLSEMISWEDIIPIVEKIEKIQLPRPSMIPVRIQIVGNSCRLFKGEFNDDKEGFISFVSYEGNQAQYTKLGATYYTVIAFIQWYNLLDK